MADDVTRRVTLKDVARAADVSLASASYAVNGTGSLGEAVRAHILKVAADLGYRQNLSARAMKTGRTGIIGLIVPDFTNPFFTALAQSVMRAARLGGFAVLVQDTEESETLERESFRTLIDRGADGVVWFPIRDENTVPELQSRVPVVVVDRSLAGLSSLRADYRGGGRLAAQHLLSLGHERVGIVSGPMVQSMRERVEGAVEALGAAHAFTVTNAFSMDLEPEALKAVLDGGATAIFAGTDLIALGVLKALRDHGRRVPEDVSVIGFGDVLLAQMSTPALTTVELPIEDMAAAAVERLMRRIEGLDPSGDEFTTSLIVRESTAVAHSK